MLHGCRSREVAPGPDDFLRNKKSEWEEYRSEATAFAEDGCAARSRTADIPAA
ncbi:hypothetical protein [Streptomyces sp. NBC_00696]|uniref:hypothetical protein n=1 Tax=Streptomyces sp. NBC_00696 TaxID=2903672 RepID=UPI002E357C3A|nr:hypothetical protein [Streptomyces sp. NBC_00696]